MSRSCWHRGADAINRTICDGVSQGTLGYATKDGKSQLVLERFKESLGESEVEISDDVFIIKAEDARKLLEPPRLGRLVIHPEQVVLKPGQEASFSCSARDQYGQPFQAPALNWTAKEGAVTADGTFTADDSEGLFAVQATVDGLEAIAEVRVARDEGPTPPREPGKQVIRWEGDVPPQKWMNFYTKVLSRFASLEDLKLRVRFEVPAEDEQARAKAEEAKAGLKELGLDDNVSTG